MYACRKYFRLKRFHMVHVWVLQDPSIRYAGTWNHLGMSKFHEDNMAVQRQEFHMPLKGCGCTAGASRITISVAFSYLQELRSHILQIYLEAILLIVRAWISGFGCRLGGSCRCFRQSCKYVDHTSFEASSI